ncbi:hypothetical protein Tco_0316398 [Tanacetum coccineum]
MLNKEHKCQTLLQGTRGIEHSFVPVDSELEVQRLKRAGQEVLEEPAKRQKIGEALGSGEEQSAEMKRIKSMGNLHLVEKEYHIKSTYDNFVSNKLQVVESSETGQ